MTPRFDPLLDPCIDDDEMMFQHYKKHHFTDSKMGSVFSLKGYCYYTQFKRFNPLWKKKNN